MINDYDLLLKIIVKDMSIPDFKSYKCVIRTQVI